MKNFIVCSILVILSFNLVLCQNYCALNCKENKHIGCQNNGTWHERCLPGARIITMTDDLKNEILHEINTKRSKVASGKTPGYAQASRMTTVTWDDELAKLAELNVRQCEQIHDYCHNTKNYEATGQCLCKGHYGDGDEDVWDTATVKAFVSAFIDAWYHEYSNANQGVIDKYYFPPSSSILWEHFVNIVHYKNNKMGCAVAAFTQDDKGLKPTLYLACNTAYNNIRDEPIYKKGKACSKCTTGCNLKYHGLCDPNEPIDHTPDWLKKH